MPQIKYRHRKCAVRPIVRPIGPSIAYVQLTQGLFSLIDAEDADKVGAFNWCAHYKKHSGTFYAVREGQRPNGTKFTLNLHAFLLGTHSDHKNLNTLDNRVSCNIRLATSQQNNYNKGMMKTNTSGYKGVFWHVRKNKWIASISVSRKRLHLGTFHDPVIAHEAYIRAAKLHAGEFARTK